MRFESRPRPEPRRGVASHSLGARDDPRDPRHMLGLYNGRRRHIFDTEDLLEDE